MATYFSSSMDSRVQVGSSPSVYVMEGRTIKIKSYMSIRKLGIWKLTSLTVHTSLIKDNFLPLFLLPLTNVHVGYLPSAYVMEGRAIKIKSYMSIRKTGIWMLTSLTVRTFLIKDNFLPLLLPLTLMSVLGLRLLCYGK